MSRVKDIKQGLEADASRVPKDVFYGARAKSYLIRRQDGCWQDINEKQMIRHLKEQGYRTKPDRGEAVSPLDAVLNELQLKHFVDYAGPLAGYKAGKYEMGGKPVLVTSSPRLIEPQKGECPTISRLLCWLLGQGMHSQAELFVSWLHVALVALREGNNRPGQAVILCGPQDTGKSLLQHLVTSILGGREAKPFQAAMGKTQFNSDLFAAEHLVVEDEAPSTDVRVRRDFGAFIKSVSANATQRLHPKYVDAITLEPFWRLTISVNDDQEHLRVLPPLDDSLMDKLLFFKCTSPDEPFNDGTPEGRKQFMQRLESELPAFVDYLINWEVPKDLQCSRYGVRAFVHPEMEVALAETASEVKLLKLIDQAIEFPASGAPWEGASEELEQQLLHHYSVKSTARGLLCFPGATGTFLSRLTSSSAYSTRVERGKRAPGGKRLWLIYAKGTCKKEDAA